MQYLVTTNIKLLPETPIAMIDGTVPGYARREGDEHFDHHRLDGAQIQIDEIPLGLKLEDEEYTFVTTQLDADACVAAAWLQLSPNEVSDRDKQKLRAIAFDCDHLAVPDELSEFADFAAQAVAALKSEGFKLAEQLGLPVDRKEWTEEDKVSYASAGFKQGTEWLIDAAIGKRPYPGELGEAKEYWEQVQRDEQQFIGESRIDAYKGCLIFDMLGWNGRYVDPRASLRAAKRLRMDGLITLTRRQVKEDGWSYTIAAKNKNLLSHYDAFRKLTEAEAIKRDVDVELVNQYWGQPVLNEKIGFDPWGGREAVGGSGWRTPSLLTPEEVIHCLM